MAIALRASFDKVRASWGCLKAYCDSTIWAGHFDKIPAKDVKEWSENKDYHSQIQLNQNRPAYFHITTQRYWPDHHLHWNQHHL